ncbi:hypothetical protein AvCA_07970 [Azotobacter vinelandii CA]|uniref:Uncharacterized protein n=2 Tax=Azotobacter vinelandii TaxID=354 RepID=C1DML2_AZOVD|nr:hypothetical protein Avin_07970 [Azotobacter vinelandii DJ]AGK15511.1 hypothetical protein AvCA_07970 [Azotobacter vinelandii CA]AGK19521.1 hypothetical protein AvCA6_07970 [Azotobacter vinelandii CA6]
MDDSFSKCPIGPARQDGDGSPPRSSRRTRAATPRTACACQRTPCPPVDGRSVRERSTSRRERRRCRGPGSPRPLPASLCAVRARPWWNSRV